MSHVMDNGEERPIAFASRSLTSETNYAQLEKEALAILFGVTIFHKYPYGRYFTLVTDHRPLSTILAGTNQGRPTTSNCPNAALGFESAGVLIRCRISSRE